MERVVLPWSLFFITHSKVPATSSAEYLAIKYCSSFPTTDKIHCRLVTSTFLGRIIVKEIF